MVIQPRRFTDGAIGGLIGAAAQLAPDPLTAAAAGAIVNGLGTFLMDRMDPIQPMATKKEAARKQLRVFTSMAKGAATGLTGKLAGPLAGAAVGVATGLIPVQSLKPVSQAGNVVGLKTMGVDQLNAQGLTGKGVCVAVLDTGAAAHPDLEGKVVAFQDFKEGKSEMWDPHGHGTGMASLVAGKYGAAPDAKLAILKVGNAKGNIESPEVLKALEWVQENRERFNIQVVNMSFYLADRDDYAVMDKLKDLASKGVITVTAAGNDGADAPLLGFKGIPEVIPVANVDTHGTVTAEDDSLYPASNRRSVVVAAPGTDIIAGNKDGRYIRIPQGTSEASALTAGVMALWKQHNPQLTVAEAKERLELQGIPMGSWRIPQATAILDPSNNRRQN